MAGVQSIDKIDKEVKRHIQPLYEVWCEKAHLNGLERKILYLKEFDDRKLNEYEQIDILQEEFNYYYDLRTYQNHWKKLKKKIYKILP
jgi:hypothetical protein